METKIKDGKVFTVVEDMNEKIFKQLSELDKVLVTPYRACPTCKEETDFLENDALKQTIIFHQETGRYKCDLIYIEDKVKEAKKNADYPKKSSENLYKKLHKLPAQLVKNFDDVVHCAKEMGALKRSSYIKEVNSGHLRRHIQVNFAFSRKTFSEFMEK